MKEFASSLSQLSPAKRRLLQKLLQETLVTDLVGPSQVIPERPEQENMVCSFSQEQLWLLDQLEPGNISYNIAFANSLQGPLHLAALERSLQEVMRRHEVLRTTFVNQEGQPRPIPASSLRIAFPLVDLQQISEDERENRVGQLLQREARKPFDLACGPLLRVLLLRLSATDHVFLLVMHHIISDGWSMKVLAQELTTLYNAFASEKPSPLPGLTLQYSDFAHWQRGYLQGEILNSQLTYWTRQLSGVVPLELPTDHPRPVLQTFNGAHQLLPLPQSLYDELRALSRREGVTLFMVLLAALQTWLYRYTGQVDIAVGTPIANRTRPGVEGLIGFFINTLVMRTDLSENPRFTELLKRVRQVTQEAFAHQDIPFAKLVAELQPERSLSHSPLFQVVFILQDTSIVDLHLELNDLTQSLFPIESGTSQADLTLQMLETRQGLAVYIEYNTDLFEANTIARMLDHWQILLEGIVAAPEQTIATLPLLSGTEYHDLLTDWNGPVCPLPPGMTVHQVIETQAERTPDALALVWGEQALSYRALTQYAQSLAERLRAQGLAPEALVAVLAERGLPLLIAVLAIWKAGGAFLPLDPLHPAPRLRQVLQQSGCPLVLTTPPFLPVLAQACPDQQPQSPQVLLLPSLLGPPAAQQQPAPAWTWLPRQLAYVIYTSGSTGMPKGVMVEQEGMLNHMLSKIADVDLLAGDHMAQTGPQSFDIFLWQALAALLVGGRVEIIADEVAWQPERLLQQVQERAISHLQVVPALVRALVQQVRQVTRSGEGPPALPTLRWLIPTGEALPSEVCVDWLQQYPQIPILNTYGSTECSDDQCHYRLSATQQAEGGQDLAIVPIGRPIANLRGYVLDAQLRLLPVGGVGELALAGVGVGRGYLADPARTAQVFVPDPYGGEWGGRMYLTGDRVRRHADGNVEFLGRRDALVKVRGYRIELGEIEAALRQHEEVQQAVVVLTEEPGQELVAYVVGTQRRVGLLEELEESLRGRLPDYLVPRGWMLLDEVPLTAHGKVDRQALPTPQRSVVGERQRVSRSASPLEELLLALWQQVLKRSEIGLWDNFFALGGHSLLATQVISRVRALLQVEVPLRSIFEGPTLAQLAQQVEQARRRQQGTAVPPPLQAMKRPAEVPLSFAQQRLWFLQQLEPENPAYVLYGGARLRGMLVESALISSLKEIVARHESLRTTFEERRKQVVQVFHAGETFELRQYDVSGLLAEEQEQEVEHLTRQEVRRPFDLARGPLFRALLFRVSDEEYVLLLTTHHIISDGWSVQVLIRELAALYQAFVAGEPSPLPSLSMQYADFVLWQRSWLKDEILDTLINYWRKQLRGATPLELPTDRPKLATVSNQGAIYSFIVPTQLAEALQALSREEGVTLFMTLLATFQVLLHRYTRQQDIIIGTDIANRTHVELEGIIGFFVNLLVLRTRLTAQDTFREILKQVRTVLLDAYAHQDLPFEKLVEVLQLDRTGQQTPLVNTLFVMQNTQPASLVFEGVTISTLPVENHTAKFDLAVFMLEGEQGLLGSVNYRSDLFDASSIVRLCSRFVVLLQSVVSAPDVPIKNLEMYTEEEKSQQMDEEILRQEAGRRKLKVTKRSAIKLTSSEISEAD